MLIKCGQLISIYYKNIYKQIEKCIPESRFLIVIRQRVKFVKSLSGGRSLSSVELASILTVCHCNSLNIKICPFLGSFNFVKRKSRAGCQFGIFDSTTILSIYKKRINNDDLIFLEKLNGNNDSFHLL